MHARDSKASVSGLSRRQFLLATGGSLYLFSFPLRLGQKRGATSWARCIRAGWPGLGKRHSDLRRWEPAHSTHPPPLRNLFLRGAVGPTFRWLLRSFTTGETHS